MRNERQIRGGLTKFETREENGEKRIEGYFAVFDSNYELWDGATESIGRNAFDGALGDDIRALIDHETRLVLGRTTAGTLTLRVDEHGLWGSIRINEADSDAMNLYARVQRGDVSQCSFGFDILQERTDVNSDTGAVHWTIEKVKLYEVSCVTFPAYKETAIQARAEEYRNIKKRENERWKAAQKERLTKWH
nr:MAG TPA: prohead serine protease [Caudoviricetes sp.]